MSATQVQGEDEFIINNEPVTQVSVVGLILDDSAQATYLNFTIDDGTGQIDVRIWIDNEESNPYIEHHKQEWVAGVYVRVVGTIRAFSTKRNIIGHRLIAIEDFNEITFHSLEVLHTHLVQTRENPTVAASSPVKLAISRQTNKPLPTKQPPPQKPQQKHQQIQQQQQQQSFIEESDEAFNPTQQAIIRLLKNSKSPNGVHIDVIVEKLSTVAKKPQILREVEFLNGEGHLFTTTDDKHFSYIGDPQ
uniref:Replication protein A C-terminal domain-containing protein n=1 Tax=Arcella intermedia TaxID=1963864 RepID=A0A6B2LDB7_9EUKA